MSSCVASFLRFAKLTRIAVDCNFHVAVDVCDYCILLRCDVIQQLLCLSHFYLVEFAGFDVMALIGHSSVLSTALLRNKIFPQTCWINFFPLLSSSGAVDGCVTYCFLAAYIMGAFGYS